METQDIHRLNPLNIIQNFKHYHKFLFWVTVLLFSGTFISRYWNETKSIQEQTGITEGTEISVEKKEHDKWKSSQSKK